MVEQVARDPRTMDVAAETKGSSTSEARPRLQRWWIGRGELGILGWG